MSTDNSMPKQTMLAALLTEYRMPLEIKTVPCPVPKHDEVLVKIEASGVCFTDVHIWRGDHAAPDPLPLIMGHEGVGTVVALGSASGRLKIGDRQRVEAPLVSPSCQVRIFSTVFMYS